MATYSFTAAELKTDSTRVQQCLDRMQSAGHIEHWRIEADGGEPVVRAEAADGALVQQELRASSIDIEER